MGPKGFVCLALATFVACSCSGSQGSYPSFTLGGPVDPPTRDRAASREYLAFENWIKANSLATHVIELKVLRGTEGKDVLMAASLGWDHGLEQVLVRFAEPEKLQVILLRPSEGAVSPTLVLLADQPELKIGVMKPMDSDFFLARKYWAEGLSKIDQSSLEKAMWWRIDENSARLCVQSQVRGNQLRDAFSQLLDLGIRQVEV